jgi:hypothetical protein
MMLGDTTVPPERLARELAESITLLAITGTSVGGLVSALALATRVLGR